MSTFSRMRFVALGISIATTAWSQSPNLGQTASAQLIEAWDISIAPDGGGLPAGRGTPAQGRVIYQAKCAVCHGGEGAGGPADQLTGGIGSLASGRPVKTVASFWPYPTTLFDYVRRAMPVTNPQSLSNDEVYALCAYLLSVDKIIAPNLELNALTLPQVQMPNRNGFISAWPGTNTGSHRARDMNRK